MPSGESNRRDFLKGESARRAVEHVLFDAAGNPHPLDSPMSLSPTLEFQTEAMACRFAVFLNRTDASGGAEAAIDALDLVAQLESQLTVYRESSEVSALNRLAGESDVVLEDRLFELLARSLEISAETNGAFDMTSGPLSKVWGFHRREGRVPDKAALEETLQRVGYRQVQLDECGHSIRFAKPGLEINLGGIGKGYALDRVAEALKSRGVVDFLAHGGSSSVLARGRRCDREAGWPLALRHPIRPREVLGLVELRDESLGTSGSGNQFFRHQGKRLGHILDPRIGWPVEDVWSVTVVTPPAADADALATAFFVLGVEEARKYCEKHEQVRAIFVLPDSPDRKPNLELIGDIELLPLANSA